jgi:glycosyltransferase involved in cell wall biosynthesis
MVMPQGTNLYLSTPTSCSSASRPGVPVVASNFPVIRPIVLDDRLGPLGTVCDPTSTVDVARALREIVDLDAARRDDLRRRCAAAARERWNWDTEAQHLLERYRLLADAGAGGGG